MKDEESNRVKESKVKIMELLSGPLEGLGTLQRVKLCLDFLGLDKDDMVCDIGCGTGSTGLLLSKRCKNVVAIDISKPLIEFLSNQPHPDNLEFCAIDATQDPPRSFYSKFDKCICMDVMEHVEAPSGLLAFISSILKREGRVVITFPINNMHHGRNYFTRDRVLNLVAKSELEADIKTLKLDRFGSFLENIIGKFQGILIGPPAESDVFNGTNCFQMMQKQKKTHSLYKFAITLLFKIHQNPFCEDEAGDRALIVARKMSN